MPGLGIHGATRWVNGHPVIQLSLLWKSDDQLWFTLFHELGHVLLHGDKDLYLNGEQTAAEEEADTYASEVLVPPAFEHRLPRTRAIAAVRELADELGIAPSIVLGRVQRKTKDYAWGHSLKRKLEFQMKTSVADDPEAEQGACDAPSSARWCTQPRSGRSDGLGGSYFVELVLGIRASIV